MNTLLGTRRQLTPRADDALRSSHFERTFKSHFAVHATLGTSSRQVHRKCQTRLRLCLQEEYHAFALRFNPVAPADCKAIFYFPYIGGDGQLHLWDVETGRDVKRFAQDGTVVERWTPQKVRQRWPKFFALAQKDGFWKHE